MKSLGGAGEMIKRNANTIEETLRYALSPPIATLVSGMDSLAVIRQILETVRDFKPMSESEMEAVRKKVRPHALDGRFELYR